MGVFPTSPQRGIGQLLDRPTIPVWIDAVLARMMVTYCLTDKSYSDKVVASSMFLTLASRQSASCPTSISRRNAAGLSRR